LTRLQLSVVIPTFNEEQALPRLLAQLDKQEGIDLQIIVADGGSGDGTVDLARAGGATVIEAGRGRGRQMNAGARAAAGLLLFLHADSELPEPRLLANAALALQHASDKYGKIAGHFPLRFAGAAPGHELFYRYLEGKTRLNRPYTINGDQGLLITRSFFDALGGFDERLPFLEDQRIAARILAQGRWIVLPGVLLTSARRFEREGWRQRYVLMALIMALHVARTDEFFERAPMVYGAQTETGRLKLQPYVELIEQILREAGFRKRWALLYRVGRFARQNTWQLFYRRDVLAGDEHYPRLRLCDRFVEPLIRNPVANALAAVLALAWFRLQLPRWIAAWSRADPRGPVIGQS
jgi:rSAM/selenodomain-associated transferase 2